MPYKYNPFTDNLDEVNSGGGGSSPLTTKGDIYTYSTADARLGVGTNEQTLIADSTQTTGIKWVGNRQVRLVSTTTVSSDTTLEFTDLSESLYLLVLKDLMFGDSFSDNRTISIRTSSNNGSTFDSGASDYSYEFYGRIPSGNQTGGSASANLIDARISSADTDDPQRRTYAEIYIQNIGNASRYTQIFGDSYGADNDIMKFSGSRLAVQADNAIQLSVTGSFLEGFAYLYQIIEGT